MLEKLLDLQFKGERSYIQGPDIYNATLDWLEGIQEKIQDIDFIFHHLAAHQLRVVSGGLSEDVKPAAVCTYTVDGLRNRIYLIETEEPITGRYPYPEDEIVASMEVDLPGRRGVLRGMTDYSDIEVWVAMTKALHYKVFPQLKGKWLFVRGRFPSYARRSQAAERALTIAASFNDKLTRNEAWLDGVKVGEIFFSIV